VRSDSTFGLSATNPNRGDFLRSPTGTDTATNTSIGWDHATDVPRYVGSGTADPSVVGVAGPVLSFYYQTTHCNDGGCTFGLWWKSGAGDTQWTELAAGSGGGTSTLPLSSPDNSIAIGNGGGLTTIQVNYGTTAATAAQGNDSRITGAEQAANRGEVGGYCPLDGSALVPVANLPTVTQSVAGAMSGADKTKLDGIASGATVDSYQVQATTGTTPGFLDAVCESTDSSITIGQTGNYLTFDANFGTSATQVCSGSTCAGLQSQLPGCLAGQVRMGGTGTATGTATSTSTANTCQNPPWQVSGNYQPTLPGGTNGQALVASVTGTGTTTNYQPTTIPVYTSMSLASQARIAAASGTATGTATQAMPADAKVARSTSRNISTTTSTATASSTATDLVGSDAQVILPVASTTAAGIVQLGTSARIVARAGTDTGSSTATQGMPIDAIATIGENLPRLGQVLFGAGTNTGTSTSTGTRLIFGYIQEAHVYGLVDSIVSKQASLGTSTQGAVLYNGSTSTSTSTSSSPVWGPPPAGASIDTATPTNVTAGAGSAGSNGKASDSGHIHHIGANTPTHGQWLVAGTDTSTSTSTTNATMWATLPVPANQVRSIYYGDNYNVVVSTNSGWIDVISVTTTFTSGRVMVAGAMSAYSTATGYCAARLTYDGTPLGPDLLATTTGGNWNGSFSPLGETSTSAAVHTIALQLGAQNGTLCATGGPGVTRAALTFTEYTN
jgi:hypothetical protein